MERGPGQADEEVIHLRDGRSCALRPVGPGDAGALVELFAGLSDEGRAMRFGGASRGIDAAQARAFAAAPSPLGVGLAAIVEEHGAERMVGLGRYDATPGAGAGEFSLAVLDAWQGLGIGTGTLESLMARAASGGLEELWGHVRASNVKMQGLLRDLGADLAQSRSAGELLVRIPLRSDEGAEEARTSRYRGAAAASLRPMFAPRSIAVVGASRDPASPGGAVFRALAGGFPGPVHPVNPRADAIGGRRAYPDLASLPEPADLAVVAVRAALVPDVAHDAARAGVRSLVVLSSGFEEAGPEGRDLAAQLLHAARCAGIRVLGPNCLGLAVSAGPRPFNATFGPAAPPPGRMAFASQSGGLGIMALSYCAARGIGLSAFASLGNKSDVSSKDLLAYWDTDPETRVILLYLEGFGEPRRFARLARQVVPRTPILAIKSGRGEAGRRGAASHTAALAAGDVLTDALLESAGVVRVDTVEELFDAGQALADQPIPAGRRVAVLSNAGGPGVMAADACEREGLEVPRLSDGLVARVREAAPGLAGAVNPIDLGAVASPAAFRAIGRLVAGSGEVDALIVIYTPVAGGEPAAVAAAAGDVADGTLAVVGSIADAEAHRDPGRRWPVPWYGFPEGAVRALARAVRAGEARRHAADPPRALTVDHAGARAALAGAAPGAWLSPPALQALLDAYGIPRPRQRLALSPDDAAAAQRELGSAVALKVVAEGVTHKTEVGGVILDVTGPARAAGAYRELERRLGGAGPGASMQGALVQDQAPPGVDMLVGAMRDPSFGPAVVVGLGGTEAELWRDRAVGLAPVGPAEARALVDRLRARRLLAGWRGAPAADVDALVDVVERVGRLIADQVALAEIDLNPVRVVPRGGGALALDARARTRGDVDGG